MQDLQMPSPNHCPETEPFGSDQHPPTQGCLSTQHTLPSSFSPTPPPQHKGNQSTHSQQAPSSEVHSYNEVSPVKGGFHASSGVLLPGLPSTAASAFQRSLTLTGLPLGWWCCSSLSLPPPRPMHCIALQLTSFLRLPPSGSPPQPYCCCCCCCPLPPLPSPTLTFLLSLLPHPNPKLEAGGKVNGNRSSSKVCALLTAQS